MRNKAISVGIIALMLFGAFTVVISTGTENVKAADDSGLVAYWDFDEGTGTVLHDKSGNGNDGTIHGATWVDGVKGKALSFDGVGDYIDCGNDTSLRMYGDITIGVWIKANKLSYRYDLVDWGLLGETEATNILYDLVITSDGRIELDHEYGAGNDEFCKTSSSYIQTTDTWYYITAVRDANINVWDVYVNGVFKESLSYGINATGGSNGKLWIGSWSGEYNFFNGTIDEVRIYNRALSAEEIQSQYDEISNPPPNSGGGGGGSTPGFEANLMLLSIMGVAVIGHYIRGREK